MEGKEGQEGGRYLGGTPGARRPSLAGPPVSAARARWGRPPTGSASSRGRRRPLVGRRRGKVCRRRVGCPQPVCRSGTCWPSPVEHVREIGGKRKGQVRLPKHAHGADGTIAQVLSQSLPPGAPSQLASGPPSSMDPPHPRGPVGALTLTGCGAFWLWNDLVNTYYGTRVCLYPHLR